MAITGEFLADFSNFIAGTRQADDALKEFEKRGETTSEGLQKSFEFGKIKEVLTDPIGAATDALDKFKVALPPVAQAAVAVAAGIGAVGTAVYKLAEWSADTAANLGDLSDQTGITVPELSKLSYAAEVAGGDIGSLSRIVVAMQTQMAKHPTEFAAGLRELGISFADFQQMKPDERITALAGGLQSTIDPVERLTTGTNLLGREYKTMAPALYDVAEAMKLVGGLDPLTKEDADNAEAFQMQLAALTVSVKALAADIGTEFIPAITGMIQALNNAAFKPSSPLARYLAQMKTDLETVGIVWEKVSGQIDRGSVDVNEASQRMAAYWQSIGDLSIKAPDADAALAELNRQIAEDKKAAEQAEAAQRKFAGAMEELNSAGTGWEGTLAGLNGDMVEAIKYYLEAGVSQNALATAYGLTSTQVKAVASAMADEQAALKASAKLKEDIAKQEEEYSRVLTGLWLQYERTVMASSDRTTQGQIDNAWRAADAQIAAMSNAGNLTTETYALIMQTAQQTVDNIVSKTLEQDRYSRSHYEQLAQQAQAAYDFALAHAEEYTQERIEQLRAENEAAKLTLLDWQAAADAALKKTQGTAEQTRQVIAQVTSGLSELGQFKPGQWSPGGKLPQSGLREMQNQFGEWYLGRADTGEFVQRLERKWGAGGFLGYGLPGGDYGSMSHLLTQRRLDQISGEVLRGAAPITVNVSGSVLSTRDDLSRLVGDAFMSAYRTGGHRVPI